MDIEGGVIFGAGGRPVNPIVWLLDEEDELVIGWRNRGVEAVKESDAMVLSAAMWSLFWFIWRMWIEGGWLAGRLILVD